MRSKLCSMRILFQGDSITDCGRNRSDPSSLGDGYAAIVAQKLDVDGHEFFNRGISGNRAYDLESRWEEDCIALKPDLVAILIGINDTWRRYDSNVASPIADFEASLERISASVRRSGAKLILLEPFVLPTPKDRVKWRDDLDPKIHAVRRVAWLHAAALVPLDGIFAAAACKDGLESLAPDGVHPSQLGHSLIAEHLTKAIFSLVG
ncbi:MAG: SGNH/GDSL hydrolase family protein [Chlorobia bacterium]|nr:SGNH/GDSL hydrolase family protein [Fimbriimonadaceae bacterium]